MSDETSFLLTFDGISKADASRLAEDLELDLKRAGIKVIRRRDDSAAQDFGATLVMVLGAPAVVIAARALHAWATRKNAASLQIRDMSGTLVANNLESKDVPKLAEAFRNRGHNKVKTPTKD